MKVPRAAAPTPPTARNHARLQARPALAAGPPSEGMRTLGDRRSSVSGALWDCACLTATPIGVRQTKRGVDGAGFGRIGGAEAVAALRGGSSGFIERTP